MRAFTCQLFKRTINICISVCVYAIYNARTHIHIYINVHLPRKMLRAHGAASISDLTNSSYYAHTHTSIYIWWWWDTTWHENLCVCVIVLTQKNRKTYIRETSESWCCWWLVAYEDEKAQKSLTPKRFSLCSYSLLWKVVALSLTNCDKT